MFRVSAILVAIAALGAAQSRPANPIVIRTGLLHGHLVRYQVVNGLAIYQGDIILGRADEIQSVAAPPGRGRPARARLSGTQGSGTAFVSERWPMVAGVAQVPYVITTGSANVTTALSQFNSIFGGIIQWVPRASQANYVNIQLDPSDHSGVCEAWVGMVGDQQVMGGSIDCATATILHEMGHTVGLWHEQSRTDRDSYVTVQYGNIDKPWESNFDKQVDDEQDIGAYDYASVMHYGWGSFSKNGLPTIESIPAGIPLSNTTSYTNEDIDTVKRLYGATPTSVTVDSNPSGAQVIVDSTTYTAPHTFAWALNTTHTVDVPAGAQTIAGDVYTFARWNDGATTAHTITITPGNGFQTAPASSPAVTVYTANFALERSFSVTVFGSGTVQLSPAPSTFSGVAGQYYPDRSVVTMTPTPSSGYNFYIFSGSGPTDLFEGNAENPKHVLMYYPAAVIAYFTTSPVTALNTNLPLSFPPPNLTADNTTYYAPKDFSQTFDPGWTPGSSHSVTAPGPQSPVTTNISYVFNTWSDGGGQTHNITASSSGTTTYTANYTGTYRAIALSNSFCAGSVSPSDTFITSNVTQNFTATPASGYVFTGWSGDNTSSTNPLPVNQSDELTMTANFNVAGTTQPIAITSLSPATVTANSGPLTLTINGTGFTNTSSLYLNNVYTPSTFVNSNQLTVQLTNSVIGSAGGVPVFVGNYTSDCGVGVEATLKVLEPTAPDLTITKTHSGNLFQGQNGATYTITVANSGSGATNGPVSVIDSLPSGLTATAMIGTNWGCTLATLTCTRSDTLSAGMSYDTIKLTVNVAGNAPSSVTNKAVVSGGNEIVTSNDSASDVTTITAGGGPPTVVSVTPNSGAGTSHTFSMLYADPNGATDLSKVYVLFNTAISGGNSCYVYYDSSTGLLYLYNNAGSATTTLTPGSGTINNSQCTLSGAGSSVTRSGNNLTMTLALTFSGTFTGSKNIYLYDTGSGGSSGWVQKGTWIAGAATPTAVSVAPSSGAGTSHSFAMVYSDPNGAADLSKVYVLFNSTLSAANGCYVYYDSTTGMLNLYNNAGSATTSLTPGSGSISNSQCTLAGVGSSVTLSGNNLTMTLALTFSATFKGSKNIYLYAATLGGLNSGWVTKGTWTAGPAAPTIVSLSPSSGSGISATFTMVYADPNGATDLSKTYVLFNGVLSAANGCYVYYDSTTGLLYLYNDAGSATTSLTPGSGSVSNSQCTLTGAGSSVTRSGNNLTMTLVLTFSGTFTGTKNVYLYATGSAGSSGWVQKGTWTP